MGGKRVFGSAVLALTLSLLLTGSLAYGLGASTPLSGGGAGEGSRTGASAAADSEGTAASSILATSSGSAGGSAEGSASSVASGVAESSAEGSASGSASSVAASSAEGSVGATAAATLVREFTYDARDGRPEIAEQLEEAGTTYRLSSVSEPVPAAGVIHEKDFTLTQTRPVSVAAYDAGAAQVRAQFAPSVALDEEGFSGALFLASVSCEPVYRTVERQIERSVEYPGLLSEETRQLPAQAEFETTSETGSGALCIQTLERTAVFWQTTGYDVDGRPNCFTATVIFRGVERELVLDYYEATAVYGGRVPADAQLVTVTAIYEAVTPVAPPPVEPSAPVMVIEGAAIPLAAPLPASEPFPFLAAAAVAIISLLVLLLAFLFWLLVYNNARLVRTDAKGHRRVLLRRRLRVVDGMATFSLPASIRLYESGATSQVILSHSLAVREGMLAVEWGGLQVLRSELREVYELDEELLALLSEGIAGQLAIDGDEDDVFVGANQGARYA